MKTPTDYMHQYVCFSCRIGRRRKFSSITEAYAQKPPDVLCSSCHKPLRRLGPRVRIPVKDRKKGDAFEKWLDKDKARFEEIYSHEALKLLRKR